MSDSAASGISVSEKNAAFWNELCGTHLAHSLGITDHSSASLKRFDDWFFAFYPYLFEHIPFELMKDKDVLEVGLGYGTVSQRIAESGGRYRGLDIAAGPVGMANLRMEQAGLDGSAQQGSILSAPFPDASFDFVVAIGCLHHTGDLRKAISECRRILRPGGKLIFMVYYSYSYRRFVQARGDTIRYFFRELFGYRGVVGTNAEVERAAYDANAAGDGAPHTDWISTRSLRSYCGDFSRFSGKPENIDNDKPFEKSAPRSELLKRWYPRWFGLDLYATATK
jgi:SAM-dependent methyltransferase